jgi:hypothetical protein
MRKRGIPPESPVVMGREIAAPVQAASDHLFFTS